MLWVLSERYHPSHSWRNRLRHESCATFKRGRAQWIDVKTVTKIVSTLQGVAMGGGVCGGSLRKTIWPCVIARLLLYTHLDATILTLTSLCSELLHGTSIWTSEIRFSSTYAAHGFILYSVDRYAVYTINHVLFKSLNLIVTSPVTL